MELNYFFSREEEQFKKGSHGRLEKEIITRVKFFLVEEDYITFNPLVIVAHELALGDNLRWSQRNSI